MNKLSAEQIILLNQKVTSSGDIPSDETRDLLTQIADAPYQKEKLFLYKHRDAIDRAAVLGRELLRHKPFAEENGKTAILAVITMLELNGYTLRADSADIAAVYRFLRDAQMTKLREWVLNHMTAAEK